MTGKNGVHPIEALFPNLAERALSKARVALFILMAVALATGLVACGPAQPGASSSGEQVSSSSAGQAEEPYGTPWTSIIFAGNVPAQAPEAKDDLYAHYAYDYIAAHQDGSSSSVLTDASGELRSAVTAVIDDDTISDSELEQLRIFYGQASDEQALEAGVDELRPYLKAIADTKSLDELEKVLLSDDFPFSPWIDAHASAPDMKSNMCLAITPHMLFSDVETDMDMYLETDDPDLSAARYQYRLKKTVEAEAGAVLLSIRDDQAGAQELVEQLFDVEKAYGKEGSQDKYLEADYGAQTETIKAFTMEQLQAACPNFPLRETLAKLGGDASGTVVVMYPTWLSAFSDVWTNENFELLRAMTELKVLAECSDFIAPSFFASARERLGLGEPTTGDTAWAACDRTDTFSQLLAKIYVDRCLGEQAVEDLEGLSNGLIDTYIDLVGKTPWLNAQSRENAMDKIDNMALNVLRPDGGYFDYSGLKLVPTEQGGTLFSNYLKLKEYNKRLEMQLLGQPARASATWLNIRPTLQNCFYDPASNSINIFPGFVTSATYAKGMSLEEQLVGMGFVVAHEISHGFDYSWSQFDAYGRPIPVFTEDDVREFVSLRQKLADRYSSVELAPGKHLDGIAVSAEAAADLSGMQAIAEYARRTDGFDYEKLFAGLAKTWAAVYQDYYVDVLLMSPHAPSNARINVSAQMADAFYEAFPVSEGDAMWLSPEERVTMWGPNAR